MTTTDNGRASSTPDSPSLGPFDPDKPQRRDADTSFEVELDPEPIAREPVHVGEIVIPSRTPTRMPIIAPGWRGWDNICLRLQENAELTWHKTAFHAARTPFQYLPRIARWSPRGAGRLVSRTLRWWSHEGLTDAFQTAVSAGDVKLALQVESRLRPARFWRGCVVLGSASAGTVGGGILLVGAPLWVQIGTGLLAVPVLAQAGRPADQRIVYPAVVAPRYRRLNSDIVLRAYYAAGLGHPDKPDQQVDFFSPMARDGEGSRVGVILPYGGTFDDAVKAKKKLASGLDVSEFQVYLTKVRRSIREHVLYVTDDDPLAIPAGKTPLLDCRPRDIWEPLFFGLNERGEPVSLLLLWISILIGAQPRKGKTFTARLFALYAALDPYVKLTVADGKMSPDWDKFRLVAHRMIVGTTPNSRDSDPIQNLLAALREIWAHIQNVNDFLSRLPVSECPEGKLTRELSRKYPQLRVWLLVMEEFQLYFETESQEINKEVAGLLSNIMSVGPSAGVIMLDSSQKPSGVGAGDVGRLFNRFRDNHAVRFALKCGNWKVSEAVLGGDAYAEGYDASALPVGPEYRGIGYLYGASDATPLVRCHLADHADAEKILVAARAHRERLGLLTGDAAGEEVARHIRDVLADALSMFLASEVRMSWPELAARLADRAPEHYADITADAISAQLRDLGVPSKNVRDQNHFKKGVGAGFDRSALTDAIRRRASSGDGSAQ